MKVLFRFKFLLALAMIVYSNVSTAQDEQRHFRSISVDNGLSQSTVYSIVQDTLGFMWMVTQEGLNRYDGQRFTVYRPVKNDPGSLQSIYLRCVITDHLGKIWVGGNKGVSCFSHLTNRFTNYQMPRKAGEWYIAALAEVNQNEIWAGSNAGELFRLKQGAKVFEQIKVNTASYGIQHINSLTWYQNDLFAGTDVGLFRINTRTGELEKIQTQVEKPNINDVFADGNFLWLGTEGQGLILYNINSKTYKNYTVANGLADNNVRGINKDSHGNIWLGTFNGLSILEPLTGRFQTYRHQFSLPYSISQNSVRCVFRDKQQGIWLGTYYAGVNYYHEADIKFNLLNQNSGSPALNDQVINVIREDGQGNFWIGTNDKGLDYWNRKTNTIRYYTGNAAGGLSSNNIKAIAYTDDGNLLVGTHNGGLNLLNPGSGRVTVFRNNAADATTIAGDMVYALLRDRQNNIWVGTRTGLDLFHLNNHQFTHFNSDRNGNRLTSTEITYLAEDSQNRLWIGTTNGITLYDQAKQLFQLFPGSLFSNEVVNCISEDGHHRIWVGTNDGLNLFDEQTKSFITYTSQKELPRGTIYGILSDQEGNLWLSTNKGLLRYNPDTKTQQNFDNRDGFQNNQFNLYAFCKANDGMMLFGGINGICYFYPSALKQEAVKLKLTFTGMEVLNRSVIPGDETGILDQHIDGVSRLKLRHEYKQFTIQFNSFNYISANRTRYFYKLDGIDNDWQKTESLPQASYTNLPPGNYLFHVKATGPQGETSDTRTLKIVLLPVWYRSNWFYLLLALAVSGIAFAVYYFLTDRLRTIHQLKIERLQREKVSAINQIKTDFFTNVSHELRTPLTLILAPLEDIMSKPSKDKQLARQHRLMLDSAKRLYSLVDQLFEFRKTEVGTRKLKVNRGDLVSFVTDIYQSFTPLAQKNQINYNLYCSEQELLMYFDKDAVERILFNLLSNAFKYTHVGDSIAIDLSVQNDNVLLKIVDTGIGITEEHLKKIFERFYQVNSDETNLGSGVGLAFTKSLVELHHGLINVESDPGSRTIFTVKIPLTDEAYAADMHAAEQSVEQFLPAAAIENEQNSLLQEAEQNNAITAEQEVTGNETLLIVDDNPEIVNYLKDYFGTKFKINIAYDGKEALELLKTVQPDLIISDVMMPELDGLHFCKRVKQNIQTSHIPFVMLTAKTEINQQVEGLEMGADDYITKPFSVNLLEAKVNRILQTRRQLKVYYSQSKEIVPERITTNSLDEEFIRNVMLVIEKQITEPDFSVDKLSREIGMSRSNLYLKLKGITGESVTDFIKRIRFKNAVELLESRKYNMSEVAYMSGFSSPSYFSTAFKQYYGYMPTEYLARKEKPTPE